MRSALQQKGIWEMERGDLTVSLGLLDLIQALNCVLTPPHMWVFFLFIECIGVTLVNKIIQG